MTKVMWRYDDQREVEAVPRWYDFVPGMRKLRNKRAYRRYVKMSYGIPSKRIQLENPKGEPISRVVTEPLVYVPNKITENRLPPLSDKAVGPLKLPVEDGRVEERMFLNDFVRDE